MLHMHAEAVHGPKPAPIYHHLTFTKETNVYTSRGDGEAAQYPPLFVHTDVEITGGISFSDPLMDAVQHITRAAALSNHQSIPTDCPQRERRGWLGDAQLAAETNFHNFDMSAAYTIFIQDPESGETQDYVPWYGRGFQPADPAWGAAYTLLADWLGTYYADDAIFARHTRGSPPTLSLLSRWRQGSYSQAAPKILTQASTGLMGYWHSDHIAIGALRRDV